jgi:hypothetical protein
MTITSDGLSRPRRLIVQASQHDPDWSLGVRCPHAQAFSTLGRCRGCIHFTRVVTQPEGRMHLLCGWTNATV